jgi:membrane AbrB-like protein
MRKAAGWLGLFAGVAVLALAFDRAGLPSPSLFAAMLLGICVALRWPGGLVPDRRFFIAAQTVVGVSLGVYVQSSTLSAAASSWLPIALVSLGTLVISLAGGVVFSRTTDVDGPTAALGLVAGGASGIVVMARELGADERLVAFMQYMRVLVVVLLTPLVAAITGSQTGSGPHHPPFGDLEGWLLTAAAAPVGMLLGRLVRLPAPSLLGPIFVAAAITLAGEPFQVPPVISTIAYAIIGLQVGLRFTLETVKQVGRLVLPMLAALLALLVGSFGLAVLLHLTAPVSLRDAYFATTPGGLYAVLAIAAGTASNVTFILATQTFRLLVMVIVAPVAVRWAARMGKAPSMETPITPDDPDIPDEPPPPESDPETDDQPMGVPAEMDPEEAPLPGLPEREPPAAD